MILSAVSLWKKYKTDTPLNIEEWGVEETDGKILRIDGDKLPANAVFRFRQEGDFILRFGGGGKTLKKFFNERKIPVEKRQYLPLIAEADGNEVYVVCGEEISEKVKVTADSRRILYIQTYEKI